MSNKRFLHYDDKGNAIQLSGKHKDNRQDKSDYPRMIERWRRAVEGGRLKYNGKHD